MTNSKRGHLRRHSPLKLRRVPSRRLRIEPLELRRLLAAGVAQTLPTSSLAQAEGELVSGPWTNPENRLDVNNDGSVTIADGFALLGSKKNPDHVDEEDRLRLPKPAGTDFVDVSGDGFLLDDDVLHINAFLDYVQGDPGIILVSPRPADGGNAADRELMTTESGGVDTFTISLVTTPTADVTVSIESSDPAEGTVSTSTLTFRPEDGITPQRVTITGVGDGTDDGDQDYTIITGDSVSDDPLFDGIVIPDIPVTNIDEAVAAAFDFGDLPDSFGTSLAGDGARHASSSLRLGSAASFESDGAASPDADGDSDDDGVTQIASLVASSNALTTGSFLVTSSGIGKLDGWIDLNGDGRFDHISEHINGTSSIDLVAGDNIVTPQIPEGNAGGRRAARFRISSSGGLTPTGLAADGEVEDYFIDILDGDGTASASILAMGGDLTVNAEESDVVGFANDIELFRVPAQELNQITLVGDDADNVFSVANLVGVFSGPVFIEGHAGRDQLSFIGARETIDLDNGIAERVQSIEAIDFGGSGPNRFSASPADITALSDTTDTLKLLYDADDTIDLVGDWLVQRPEIIDGNYQHVVNSGDARIEITNAFPHQNPLDPFDPNRTAGPTVLDPLIVINSLARGEGGPVSVPTNEDEIPAFYLDVRADNNIAVLDAILIINLLSIPGGGGQGEQIASLVAFAADADDESGGGVSAITEPTPIDFSDSAKSHPSSGFSVADDATHLSRSPNDSGEKNSPETQREPIDALDRHVKLLCEVK